MPKRSKQYESSISVPVLKEARVMNPTEREKILIRFTRAKQDLERRENPINKTIVYGQ
ncbi:MAG: hypothetical protein LBL21_00315 [Rickettsiales bacterium]|jgi:hypothetical protein|nr:hypothetical protein [Rickettsiales bacterium]